MMIILEDKHLQQLLVQDRRKRVKWGFEWAIWAAVLWGLWYVPGTIVWSSPPFNLKIGILPSNITGFLISAAVISFFNSFWIVIFVGVVWLGVLKKWKEFLRTLRNIKISKWYVLGSFFGGPIAIFGSYLAMGYIGGAFAAAAALLYPITGALLARIWYKEKITHRTLFGILVIIAGGILIWNPRDILANIANPAAPEGIWLGYLGGVMAAVGWGIEGAIVGQALDVSDPDASYVVRFLSELLLWFLILFPIITLASGIDVYAVANAALNMEALPWLALSGLTFGFCYVCWYKSFPLIGVGRGQALANLFVIVALTTLWLFLGVEIYWWIIVGALICLFGAFFIYYQSGEKEIGISIRYEVKD